MANGKPHSTKEGKEASFKRSVKRMMKNRPKRLDIPSWKKRPEREMTPYAGAAVGKIVKEGVKKIVKKIKGRHKDLDLPGMPGPEKGKYPGIDKAMKNIKESGDIFGKAEGGRIGRATHGYGKAYMKGGRVK